MLHNIATTVPSWSKVNSGLMKMYKEEVLKKVPVVQHFRFGSILGWRKKGTGEEMSSSGDGNEGEGDEGNGDSPLQRESSEGTVAPWALPSLSGTTAPPYAGLAFSRQPSLPTTAPRSFNPPAPFPARRASLLGQSEVHVSADGTIAGEGGAAASTSPFGILHKPNSGSKPSSSVPWSSEDA
jgi:hypothetical protein